MLKLWIKKGKKVIFGERKIELQVERIGKETVEFKVKKKGKEK